MASAAPDITGLDAETEELVESLGALTKEIVDNAKGYKDATGQQGLLQRRRMTNAARKVTLGLKLCIATKLSRSSIRFVSLQKHLMNSQPM